MKKGAKPQLSAKWWSKNKAKTLKSSGLGKALSKWEQLRKELDDPQSRNKKLFSQAQKALLDVQKTATLAQDKCNPKKHAETLACLKLFPKAVTDAALKVAKEEKKYNDTIATKPANFVWAAGRKMIDNKLWEDSSSAFRMEVFLHPATPAATLARLTDHLNNYVTREWKPVENWHKGENNKLAEEVKKMAKEGKGNEIAKQVQIAEKSLAGGVADRIERIGKGLPAEVDNFLAKNAETKRLAKEFKTRTKTRLTRDLILGNISNTVAAIFGGVTGGISGGASGASLGALGGPVAEVTVPVLAAVGAVIGALIGPVQAILTGVVQSIKAIQKYTRVESDYRNKLQKELADTRKLFQAYSTVVAKGGAGWNVSDIYTKWSGAVSARTQKLAKALEQHKGSVAVLQQTTDKESQKLVKLLDKTDAKERDLVKVQKELEKAEKEVRNNKDKEKVKEKRKVVDQLDKELKKPRGAINKLIATMANANEFAQTSKDIEERHKGLLGDVQEVLKNLDGKKAELLGAKTAKRLDGMVDVLHKVAPFSDAFLSTGKSVTDGLTGLVKALKKAM